MSAHPPGRPNGHARAPGRRSARIVLVLALALLALLLALRFALQPQRATQFLLQRVGATLGLEITATRAAEYQLRGTPMLVVRDVVAREPGAREPLLTADRILLSLPWSTIRARGAVLSAERLELDGPVLRLDALRHWLSTRPPAEAPRLPTLTRGLAVRDAVIRGGTDSSGWRVAGLSIDLPSLAPEAPLRGRVRGRYEVPPTRVPFELAVAMQRAAALVDATPTGLGVVGRIAVVGEDWRLPAHLRLSGPFLLDGGKASITPLTAGLGAQYESHDSHLPFALGVHGPLRFAEGVLSLAPVQLVANGRGQPASADPIPDLHASGRMRLAGELDLDLDGSVARWPDAWPALPAPLSRPRGPVDVSLDYRGPAGFDGIVHLQARHGGTDFDGRFRIAAITGWLDSDLATPLPPLDGSARTPLLEIAGARLEGVEVSVDDASIEGDTE